MECLALYNTLPGLAAYRLNEKPIAIHVRQCLACTDWALNTRTHGHQSVSYDIDHTSDARVLIYLCISARGGSVAEWLACWTQAQNGLGSNRSRDAVG